MSRNDRRTRAHGAPRDSFNPDSEGDLGHRRERLQHVLKEELQSIIEEAADAELWSIRVLAVSLSVDAAHARVAYAVEGERADESQVRRSSELALKRAEAFLRARLSSQLSLKRTPKLSFTFVGVAEPGGGA